MIDNTSNFVATCQGLLRACCVVLNQPNVRVCLLFCFFCNGAGADYTYLDRRRQLLRTSPDQMADALKLLGASGLKLCQMSERKVQ